MPTTTTIVNPIFEGTGLPLTLDTAPLAFQKWNLPFSPSASTVPAADSVYTFVGSAAASSVFTPIWARLNTGGTANSSVLYRGNPNAGINFGRGNFGGGVQFNRPVWLIWQGQMDTLATQRIRIQLGGVAYNNTTVGTMTPTDSSFSGLGFLIDGAAIKLETINTPGGVATHNTSATLATHSGTRLSLKAYSDGLGNVKVYVNEALVATLAIGPTQGTSNAVNQLRVSVENRSGAAAFIDLIQDQISVIVE